MSDDLVDRADYISVEVTLDELGREGIIDIPLLFIDRDTLTELLSRKYLRISPIIIGTA